jgi:ATP-binding cassette subfamily F protein uup
MSSPKPVNLVSLEQVSVTYGVRRVLDAVSLGVAAGDRIGIVGRNGDGKSTLVNLLAGRTDPPEGRVARSRTLTTGLLAQHDELDPTLAVREAVLGNDADHVWARDPRAREVLGTLLGDLDLSTPVAQLSGGERRRAALARLLMGDPDLLVLDEPTNHLDIEAITWLANHLVTRFAGQRKRALVVVTHDRWFLDAVCDRTWEVHDGGVTTYDGGYAAYVLARAERDRVAVFTDARRQNLLRKELAWLRRGPPARTSKPKFRIDAANALIDDEPAPRDRLALSRLATARLGKKVLELHDVKVTRGGRVLLDDITVRFGPGDRIGILGPNGAGKTTMLSLLTGEAAPDSGRIERGSTVRVAHLSQGLGELDPTRTVLQSVAGVHRVTDATGGDVSPTSLLERFGFTGDRLVSVVRDLSGGERRRLQVLRLLLAGPNVLLLDEPTNDLDIDTLTVLEDFLDGWPGSLLVVSHDRYFLERVCDTVWSLTGDGTFTMLPGGVEQYLERRAALIGAPSSLPTESSPPGSTASGVTAATRRQAAKEITKVERQLARLTSRERELHDQLAEHASDYARLTELDSDLKVVTAEMAQLEERWFELTEQAEQPG